VSFFFVAPQFVAPKRKVDVTGQSITAHVITGSCPEGGFGLATVLNAHLPGHCKAEARELIEEAHEVCLCLNTTRGNMPAELRVAI
jgi:lipoyl-dependent peroxiredoxin